MPFLYGGNVLKAHVGRWSEDCPEHQGVVVLSMNRQVSSVQHERCNDFLTVTSLVSQKLSHPLRGTALFNFQSLLTITLLLICACAYIRSLFPSLLDRNKTGFLGMFWKCARIGERKSQYVAVACVMMAVNILFWS